MKKIILTGMLITFFNSNAQLVQENGTTGAGLSNGAVFNTGDFNGENTFFGNFAGRNNNPKIDLGKNTFIGHYSGYSNNTGLQNTFLGWNSGYNNTTGLRNVFLGANAGANSSGNLNSFIGSSAGINNKGIENNYIGGNSGLGSSSTNASASYNTFIGNSAGISIVSGAANIFIGHASGFANQTGGFNTYIGFTAGQNATGSNNIFIGSSAGRNQVGNDKLVIANTETTTPLVFGDFASNKLGIGGINTFPTTAGNVNVSAYTLFVKGGILTEEVRVALKSGWADYVFAPDYKLSPLSEVEKFIKQNNHLPNVPSAAQVKSDGIALGDMSRIQQEKIEELTLYVIEQDKQLQENKKELSELKELVKTFISQKR